MFKRRTKIVGMLMAVAGAVAPAVVTAAPAEAATANFRFGIQMIDNKGRSEQGSLQVTPFLIDGGGFSDWAYDTNQFDPDGARLLLSTTGIPTNLDFRICGQAIDNATNRGAEIGPLVCSAFASEGGGGFSPLVTDPNRFDPDGYRVILSTRPLPPGVEILDVRLAIAAFDNDPRGFGGITQFTPWLSQGGGFSPYAFDRDSFDPDGYFFGIDARISRQS